MKIHISISNANEWQTFERIKDVEVSDISMLDLEVKLEVKKLMNDVERFYANKALVGNLEGQLGSSHMQGTPKAQGHEADNLNEGSAR